MSSSLEAAIIAGAEYVGVALDDAIPGKLVDLLTTVHTYSKRINLIAPVSLDQAVERHVVDSLAMLKTIEQSPTSSQLSHWWDVGTGGGFPGLVWAVARPEMHVPMVERIAKKAALVHQLSRNFAPGRARVVTGKFETLQPPDEPIGLVSRAVFAPEVWLEKAKAFAPPQSVILVTMGRQEDPGVVAEATRVDRFMLPISEAARANALIET